MRHTVPQPPPQGIAVTPEFGSYSGIATTLLASDPDGTPVPAIAMTGFQGPFEPQQARQQAAMQLHRYVLRQGRVVAVEANAPG